ncbi:MAG TPA: endonuclease/exonuclease/phosphatase family protein [Solirubrobacterales bacterium]|nr:endonuclease/exonuclease/phosphatase family protein [Solirubrobacterales bacterium]
MQIRAITWNVFHGRDRPPDPALRTWRSLLLRITERNATHVGVNRDLYPQFEAVIAGAAWDVLLLQEFPPRWEHPLAAACRADPHIVLTSRNYLPRLSAAIARFNPDLIGSWEGGSNLTLVRGEAIAERRELVIRERRPERRAMAFTRLASGACVANLHTTTRNPPLATEEVLLAAARATEWAGDAPLIFGGDLNLRPGDGSVFDELAERHGLRYPTAPDAIDHLLARGLEAVERPHRWPPEARELPWDGLRVRLSDHTPIEALFRTV